MTRIARPIAAVALAIVALSISATSRGEAPASYDVLVYGGTPAGIAAAVQAGREGATVVLVEPTGHVGGLTTSGLSHVDYRSYEGLTGFYLEFTKAVESHYRDKYGEDSPQLRDSRWGTHGEPHVNELVFDAMLARTDGVTVEKNLRLTDVATIPHLAGPRRAIESATFAATDGTIRTIAAKVFVDATYEGDLMAKAGVAYVVGREGREEFGENLAPERGDDALQGYNFRAIMTKDPANRVAVEKPAEYDRERFVGILDLFADGRLEQAFGNPYEGTGKSVFKDQIPKLPNGKVDINDVSRGPVRLSLPGEQLAWPDGDEETRAAIREVHRDWQVGLLWFLQHDEAVPAGIRKETLAWGWARDEFVDNGHFPWQLYVREARRMRTADLRFGDFGASSQAKLHTFTQSDVAASPDGVRAVFQPESIAMGDYGPNCHGTGHEGPSFGGKHVGEFYQAVAPYQIPYGCLISPQVANLLVPVACASSHVGFCALRLEPIWTSLGQAAGVAASLAAKRAPADVADIGPSTIRWHLRQADAATIYVADVLPGDDFFQPVQWIGSLGGLHGLQSADGRPYGTRGARDTGQYHRAYPGHAFEGDKPLTQEVRDLWTTRILESCARGVDDGQLSEARAKELSARISTLLAPEELTRGEGARILFEAAGSDFAR